MFSSPNAGPITASQPSRRLLAVLLLALALSWFGTLDFRKLIAADEGRYAEIAREMAISGDWITPRYNGVKYFEKPPLQYWTTALAFRAFGENEWTARLWTGLTGFAGILLIYFTGRKLFDPWTGLIGAAILASSFLWVAAGHVNSLDMGVTFFLECALCFLLLAQQPGVTRSATRRLMLACWASMAFAVLSKGLIGIVLPGLVLAVYLAVTRETRLLARLHSGSGLLLFLGFAAPWFLAVSIRNPEFAGFFFLHEHFGRYLTVEGYNRHEPWWFFPALILGGLMPWSLALAHARVSAIKAPASTSVEPTVRPDLILAIWVVVITVFFSVSRSKLPGYILPVFPALALLLGAVLARLEQRRVLIFLWGTFALSVVAVLLTAYVTGAAPTEVSRAAYRRFGFWAGVGIAVIATGTLLAALVARRSDGSATIGKLTLIAFAVSSHLGLQTMLLGHDALRERMSSYDLAAAANQRIDRSQPFYSIDTLDHTLSFYVKKTMTMVAYRDELEFGLTSEPHLWIPSIEEFRKSWASDRHPMAVMPEDTFLWLRRSGLPMEVVVRNEKRIVVEKPQRRGDHHASPSPGGGADHSE